MCLSIYEKKNNVNSNTIFGCYYCEFVYVTADYYNATIQRTPLYELDWTRMP